MIFLKYVAFISLCTNMEKFPWQTEKRKRKLESSVYMIPILLKNGWYINICVVSRIRHSCWLLSCCCTVLKSGLTLCDPMDYSMPGYSVLHTLPKLFKLMPIESVMPSNHLLLCYPLLLLSVFLSIRIFSNRSVLHIRWPKYWSFSFSISPSD